MTMEIDNVYEENLTNEIKLPGNITNEVVHNFTKKNFITNEEQYKYYIPPMLVFCLASIVINLRVLLSIYWIRKPLTPILHISLSLAAADACTSAFLGIGLVINSYLATVFKIYLPCFVSLIIEMFRLSGVIITVFHLLALSINHYLGILRPLRYMSLIKTKKTTISVISLWIFPVLFIKLCFLTLSDSDFWTEGCKDSFLYYFHFRLLFSLIFFIPFILMGFCYIHILITVKQQQKIWTQLSRYGSTRNRSLRTNCQQRRTLEGNVKAVYTTLLILGSCVIGWLPAVLLNVLICKEGCYFTPEEIEKSIPQKYTFFIIWISNLFVILKTLMNPIIYSTRMIEIKVGVLLTI